MAEIEPRRETTEQGIARIMREKGCSYEEADLIYFYVESLLFDRDDSPIPFHLLSDENGENKKSDDR